MQINQGQKRQDYITVWMTRDEKNQATENAQRARLPMSTFSRKVLLEAVVPQAAPSKEWMQAYSQTARWSANLNQLCHNLNSARLSGLLEPTISSSCSDMEFLISEMAKDVEDLRQRILTLAG